jgi:hypothetical protein
MVCVRTGSTKGKGSTFRVILLLAGVVRRLGQVAARVFTCVYERIFQSFVISVAPGDRAVAVTIRSAVLPWISSGSFLPAAAEGA